MKEIKLLKVLHNEQVVGYLRYIKDNQIAFEYDDEWLEKGFSISPLSLPLKKQIFINHKDTFCGLYGVFYDSLSDGWGELLTRKELAKQGVNYSKLNPLTKLAFLNDNSLGGLRYEPSQYIGKEIVDIDLDKIAKESLKIYQEEEVENFDNIYQLGGSSGGSRPKIHIKNDEGEWIVKFRLPFEDIDAGMQEYKANKTAKECGINVNDYKLFSSHLNPEYFGCRRFDRKDGKRIHVISLSSILETSYLIPNLDYYHLFQVIDKICVDKEDLYEAFRRMCFNVFYGNKDDHGKNFAFLYDEEKKGYRLTPFYDINKVDKVEHEMTVNGNGNSSVSDMIEIARKMNLSIDRCIKIIDKIKEIVNSKF